MNSTERFSEVNDILATLPSSAANAGVGAHNSGYVSLADYHRAFALLNLGEPGQDATIDVAVTQATDALGTGAKALTTPAGVTKNPAQIVAGDAGGHVGIEIRSEELDVTGGFGYIQVALTVGTATYYSNLTIFGTVSRYEPVDVTDYLYLMP